MRTSEKIATAAQARTIPPRRKGAGFAFALASLLLVGCAGIPGASGVQDVTKVAAQANQSGAAAPTPGQTSDNIVRGFIAATGSAPTDSAAGGAYAAAKQYLTPDAQRLWPTAALSVVILPNDYRVDVDSSDPGQVTISGTTIGSLDPTQEFHQSDQSFTQTLRLVKVNGQWRISQPPKRLLMVQRDFAQTYVQRTVYFLDATGTVLVPDQRYINSPAEHRAGELMDLLLKGPAGVLAGVARSQLTGALLRTNVTTDDAGLTHVNLTGIAPPTLAARRALAAQVVYTLSSDYAYQTIEIRLDGDLLEPSQPTYSRSNFQSFDPDRTPGTGPVASDPYYINNDPGVGGSVAGRIVDLLDQRPVPGELGNGKVSVASAAMSAATGVIAATTTSKGQTELVLGKPTAGGVLQTALKATTLTTPSFSRAGDEVWVVQNGATKPEIYQISATVTGTESASRAKISSTELTGKGPVTALQISPDGLRVAIIAGNKLYIGAVSSADGSSQGNAPADQSGTDGKSADAISNLTLLGDDMTDVEAVAFNSSTELMVASKRSGSTFRTVSRVAIDGSYEIPVTTTDLNNDVDSLAVSGPESDMYVTFGGRVFKLSGSFADGRWTTPPNVSTSVLVGEDPFFPS